MSRSTNSSLEPSAHFDPAGAPLAMATEDVTRDAVSAASMVAAPELAETEHVTRAHLHWRGTLDTLSQANKQQTMFGRFGNMWTSDSEQPRGSAPLNLSRARIRSIKARSINNKLPFAVHITLGDQQTERKSDFLNQMATQRGKVAMVVHAAETSRVEHVIYTSERTESLRMYHEYASVDLPTERKNIVEFPHENYCHVPLDSVVVRVLRKNPSSVFNVDSATIYKNRYCEVPKDLVDTVFKTLQQNVLCKLPFSDLTSMTAKIARVDGATFNTIEGSQLENLDAAKRDMMREHVYDLSCELEITYTLPAVKNQE